VGKPRKTGCMRASALTSRKLGRLTEEMSRFRTGPGKTGRPGLSGGLRKRSHGGNENPPRNRKSELGNPPPTVGAPEFYPNQFKTAKFGSRKLTIYLGTVECGACRLGIADTQCSKAQPAFGPDSSCTRAAQFTFGPCSSLYQSLSDLPPRSTWRLRRLKRKRLVRPVQSLPR
jgi:hypothetical protein